MPTKPETILKKIDSLPDYQSRLCLKFKKWLEYENDNSERNWINYLKILSLFANHIENARFEDVTRDDVLSFLDKRKKSIDDDPDKKWIVTWNGYLSRLLGFYRWMYNHDKEQDREKWITPEMFSSIKRKKNKRISSYSPTDVWNIDEILTVVKYCTNPRDKAILTIAWDMAARNHEMVKLRLKDIIMKEKYAEATTSWDTKTGMRTSPLIISFPYVRELINSHPFANSPDSFLILSHINNKPLNSNSIWGITNDLKNIILKMLENGDIRGTDKEILTGLMKKPWNPYLIGRHSSLTEKTNLLTDHQLTKYAGWVPSTKRRETYIHMSGKEVNNPLLQYHGIEIITKPKPTRKECSKCGCINAVENSICSQCSFVLNARAWHETKSEEEQEKKDLNLTISVLKQKIENLEQNQIDEQIRFEQYFKYREQKKKQEVEDELMRHKQYTKLI